MLNNNIKRTTLKKAKKPVISDPKKDESETFIDIDGYFKKALEHEIKEREQELRIQPTEFKRYFTMQMLACIPLYIYTLLPFGEANRSIES